MNRTLLIIAIAVAFVLVASVVPALAHGRGGVHGSIWIGPAWGWGPGWGYPYSYPYPYYYPYYSQPPVVIEQQTPVYEEQAPQQQQEQYWYYCPDSKIYYPYVKQCPGGWMKVVPTPAPK